MSAPSALTLAGYPKERELAFITIALGSGILGAFMSTALLRSRGSRIESILLAGIWIMAALLALKLRIP